MKYWLGKDKETKIVVISDKGISTGNPPSDKFQTYRSKLLRGEVPADLFMIPFSYITLIEMKNIEKEIKFHFGNESSEVIKINDPTKKKEIFEVLKGVSPNLLYESKEIGKFGAAKKPLTALLVLTPIFTISYYMAFLLENDGLYGNQVAILLAIASLGSKNIIKIFGLILAIILAATYKKMSNTYVLHSIKRKN